MRAFRECFAEIGQLWIIGTIPAWIDRSLVRCIEFPDPYEFSKDANIIAKAIRLASEIDLSEKFIFASDDQIPVQSGLVWDDFGPFWTDELWPVAPSKPGCAAYEITLARTGRALWQRRLPTYKFDSHTPAPLEKKYLPRLLEWDFGVGASYAIHSLYFNPIKADGIELPEGLRLWIDDHKTPAPDEIMQLLSETRFMAFTEEGILNRAATTFVEERFSEPGAWEQGGRITLRR